MEKVLKSCEPSTCVGVSQVFFEFYVALQSLNVQAASITDNEIELVTAMRANCVSFCERVFCQSAIYSEHKMDLPDLLLRCEPRIKVLLFEH